MIRSSSLLRDVSAAAAAAVLALLVGLSAAVPAQAEDGEPTPQLCLLNCETASTEPKDPGKGKPEVPPVVPSPVVPTQPAAPAPVMVPTLAPEPSASPTEESPSAAPSTTIPSPPSSATASTEPNWNKPVTKSAKPTQAAAVSRNDGSGLFGGPGLLAIMAGVLLVGVAGLAFAWWSRNRLSSH
ncbi:hypothetical protein NFC73_03960 [Pseudarthrobacter sp. RMG13]|uniref:Uncharacterized protein n=1 Tax=Pseudarthrobacter humi TaxID=2952523 RepID=A0ABT1LLD1_9MICC|nr:hypothetical protein [Pseudarthrobacter humi]MCP8998894.1 hypothetical protein [Pseudarthrobacter humi]